MQAAPGWTEPQKSLSPEASAQGKLIAALALQGERAQLSRLLMQPKADYSLKVQGAPLATYLTSLGWYDLAMHCKAKGADSNTPNEAGDNVYSLLAKAGRFDLLRYFLTGVHDVEQSVSYWKQFALHHHIKTQPYDFKDTYGNTTLIMAAELGDIDSLHYLLSLTPYDANAQNVFGETALMKAARHNTEIHYEIVQILCKVSDIEIADNNSNTALMWAARLGSQQTFQYLLAQGANRNAANLLGSLPLVEAQKRGFIEL